MMAAMGLLGACAEADEQQKAQVGEAVTIQLTANVASETLTMGNPSAWTRDAWDAYQSRALTRGIQETTLINGQKVYLWADKGTAGTYTFLQAWNLTSDGSGGLSGTTKYYPTDGDGLTFRAVHGNFSTAPTEGTAIGTLTHTVLDNQSTAGNYEKSDLMDGEGTGSWESAGIVNFVHKLSKIEVNLTPGIGLIPSDMTSATVQIRGVKPTVSINAQTGELGSASGTATTITARHTGNGCFEAVIPPQTAPSGVLTVTIGNVTATIPNAVATFASNSKYVYNVKCTNKDKHLNPLWYVAENNVKSYNFSTKVVTLETSPTAAGSAYCYSWVDAMGYFSKTGTSYDSYWIGDITDGTTGFKYHLPCRKEWLSMLPSESTVFSTGFMPSGGLVSSAQPCIFGYSDDTKTGVDDWSYWSTYTTANVRYALRYLGTRYCSAWKYEFSTSTKVLTVTAKLIDYLDKNDATLGTKLSTYMNNASFWTTLNEEEGAMKRQFYAVGYRNNSDNGGTGTADYWPGEWGYCWSATEVSDDLALSMDFGNGRLLVRNDGKKYGFTVRLFRNEGLAEARVRPKLPIEYIAPYNMKTATSMATDNLKSHSGYFCWNTSKASSGGVGTPSDWSKAKANIQAMIKGTAVAGYHLPSKLEWCSVVAPYYAGSNDSNMGGSDNQRITYKRGSSSNLSETVAWGVTNNNGTYTYDVNQVFYNDYNCPNDAAHTYIGYGLRFKEKSGSNYVNGRYTCAFRYEYKSSDSSVGGASLTIKVTYVGANTSVTISTISNESWWTSPDFTVVLPACGYSPYSNGSDQAAGWSSATNPAYGFYWSATARDASVVHNVSFAPSYVVGNDWNYPGHGFSVRLFKDK